MINKKKITSKEYNRTITVTLKTTFMPKYYHAMKLYELFRNRMNRKYGTHSIRRESFYDN